MQSVINFASTHVELMPITNVGGYTNEPALSLCNDTLQELCSPPFPWKFNRNTQGILTTQAGIQDYPYAGASVFSITYGAPIDLASNSAITESGTTVTVNTLIAHQFKVGDTVYITGATVAAYNSTYTKSSTSSGWSNGWTVTAVPTATSFTFTHTSSGLGTSGAPGITDFAWGEYATMYAVTDNSPDPYQWEVQFVRDLKPSSEAGRPTKLAVISDNGSGVLTIRFSYVPNSTVFAVTFTYQKQPPLATSLTSTTWAPFPDHYGFVYRQAFLARCYRYLNSPRADAEEAKAEAMIQKALDRDDSEAADQYVTPATPLMDWGWGW
jgi:hypothetical protein